MLQEVRGTKTANLMGILMGCVNTHTPTIRALTPAPYLLSLDGVAQAVANSTINKTADLMNRK